MPKRGRIHYNLGLLLQQLGRLDEAEASLLKALNLSPNSRDELHAVADHYLRRGKIEDARSIIKMMLEVHPEDPLGHQLIKIVNQMSEGRR